MGWLANRFSIVAIIVLSGCFFVAAAAKAFDCSINCESQRDPDKCRHLRRLNCPRAAFPRQHHWHHWSPRGYGYGYDYFKRDGTSVPSILETVFSPLYELGAEEGEYGLFSYLLVPADSPRSQKLMKDIFSSIPTKNRRAADKNRINILYIPTKSALRIALDSKLEAADAVITEPAFAIEYSKDYYDYILARKFLNTICSHPDKNIAEFCGSDLSSGPYIFTYRHPATGVDPVPSPFLLVDLSSVHERAFPEFLRAYKEQVKRKDMADSECINTFRLRVVSIVLTGADLLVPLENAFEKIIHLSSDAEAAQPAKRNTGAKP